MNTGGWTAMAVAACAAGMTFCAQPPDSGASTSGSSGPRLILVSESGPRAAGLQGGLDRDLLREIDDPHTGDRWLLERDPGHPGGPGRLVLAGRGAGSAGVGNLVRAAAVAQPVIRAGDRLIVEENSAVVTARLEAFALGPAWPGSALEVRLRIGGKVLRAVALGPGRAALQPVSGVEP